MIEFKINDYIVLKLEDSKTNIYISDKLFKQCKFLLLNIPINNVEAYDEIASIDEAEEQLDGILEDNNDKISLRPDVEFWAHCSSLQAWYENGYDSCLLHRNLAFPLLKKLTEVGDSHAIRMFKEEIMKRLNSNHPNVIKYLIEEHFIDYLDREDVITSLINLQEAEIILMLEQLLKTKFRIDDTFEHVEGGKFSISIQNKKIIRMQITGCSLKELPEIIKGFKNLKYFYICCNEFSYLPEWIGSFEHLEILDASSCGLETIPSSIGKLNSLKMLKLSDNYITELPKSIGKLTNLIELDLSANRLNEIPSSIDRMGKIKYLDLSGNSLNNIPSEIGNLSNLEILFLELNHLQNVPDSMQNLKKLKRIDIVGNYLDQFPSFLLNLPEIKEIKINNKLMQGISKEEKDNIKLKKIYVGN